MTGKTGTFLSEAPFRIGYRPYLQILGKVGKVCQEHIF
jgi:hypothetical protein